MRLSSIAHIGNQLLLLVVVCVLLAGCSSTGVIINLRPSDMSSPDQRLAYMVTELDSNFRALQQDMQPGASIIVKKDGEIIYQRSKGVADIKQNLMITKDTAFNLASLSKPITATATMMLVEKKVLSLNDSILKWMPELSEAWGDITIHHLLTHQSGLPAIYTRKNLPTLDGTNNQQVIKRFIDDDTRRFLTGEGVFYSNSNYLLLSEIISRASGESYTQFLQQNIFVPLDMKSTFIVGQDAPNDTVVALNYGTTDKTHGISTNLVGHMGITGTASDLDKLVSAFVTGKLVSRKTLLIMTTAQSGVAIPNQDGFFSGYGWFVPPPNFKEPYYYAHRGSADGYKSIIRIYPDAGIEFIGVSNGGERTAHLLDTLSAVVHEAYITIK